MYVCMYIGSIISREPNHVPAENGCSWWGTFSLTSTLVPAMQQILNKNIYSGCPRVSTVEQGKGGAEAITRTQTAGGAEREENRSGLYI